MVIRIRIYKELMNGMTTNRLVVFRIAMNRIMVIGIKSNRVNSLSW